jgi:agmatine deiminase
LNHPIPSESVDWPNYRLPAEWEKHEATFLAWPHNAETWPGLLEPVQQTYIAILRALLPGEKVYLLAKDCEAAEEIRTRLEKERIDLTNLRILNVPSDDAWVRDSGPIFVLRKDSAAPQRLAHDFVFNSWGRKYGPWDHDDIIPARVCQMLDAPWTSHDFVLEGGSLDTDGQGTLLTTEQCLLNPNRNPSFDRKGIEERLRQWLGIQKVIWLHDGLEGDDTDGHVDDISRFVAPGVVVTVVEPDERDANHAPLAENVRRLRLAKDASGKALRVVELPMPPRADGPHHRNPASHANFYIANSAVLVPVFASPTDSIVLERLRPFFPDRSVVGIDCRDLVSGLGAIHCITQQMPALLSSSE